MGVRDSPSLLVGLQTGLATVEIRVENSQKAKLNLSRDPAVPLLGLLEKDLTSYSTDSSLAICCSIHNSKTMRQPKRPSTDKENVMNLHYGIPVSCKGTGNENLR